MLFLGDIYQNANRVVPNIRETRRASGEDGWSHWRVDGGEDSGRGATS